MNNKLLTWFTLLAFTFVSIFLPFPTPSSRASAQSTGSLRVVNAVATSSIAFSFKKDLMLGDTDPDVLELQRILNASIDTAVSSTGPGSAGHESTYFGDKTKAAVIKFQEKYGISGNGFVGKATRTQLNNLIGVSVTVDSVGLPQSRANARVSSGLQTSTATTSAVCRFVEILISSSIIPGSKANPARLSLGCAVPVTEIVSTPASSSAICQFVEVLIGIGAISSSKADQARGVFSCKAGTSSIDLKVNGSDGPITVVSGSEITLTWKSYNTISCSDGKYKLPTSGRAILTANKSLSYPMTCIGTNGQSVVDTVVVIVSDQPQATSSIKIIQASVVPGYDYADVKVATNIAARLVVTYTDDPTSTSSVRVVEDATSTAHSVRLTGLTPNTVYHLATAIISAHNGNLITDEVTFRTLSSRSSNTNGVTQKVLSSTSGRGVVAVPESPSLNTKNRVTLEAWVKPTSWNDTLGVSGTKDSVIISKGNVGGNIDYALTLDAGKLAYSNNDGSIFTCSEVVPLNEWTHVAASIDENSGDISLYVNGERQSSLCEGARGVFSATGQIDRSNAITENVATTTGGGWGTSASTTRVAIKSNVYFGNFYPQTCGTDFAGNGFIGLIDDIKIWNTARTEDQIRTDSAAATTTTATTTSSYSALLPTYHPQPIGLVGHWTFDGGNGADLTYNMNNAVLKGDMKIVDDESALSEIAGPLYSSNSNSVFPESCDAALGAELAAAETVLSGYRVTFKGGVEAVAAGADGSSQQVTLETCDNPTEDLVKSVEVIGDAPPRDPSYFNNMGNIAVIIANGLGMSTPSKRDTIQGTAISYTSVPGQTAATQPQSTYAANSVGYAENWTPVTPSCMKPPDNGLFGNWAVVGAVVLVVAAVASCVVGCIGVPFVAGYTASGALIVSSTGAALGMSAGVAATAAVATSATAGYMVGSSMQCDEDQALCS